MAEHPDGWLKGHFTTYRPANPDKLRFPFDRTTYVLAHVGNLRIGRNRPLLNILNSGLRETLGLQWGKGFLR